MRIKAFTGNETSEAIAQNRVQHHAMQQENL